MLFSHYDTRSVTDEDGLKICRSVRAQNMDEVKAFDCCVSLLNA